MTWGFVFLGSVGYHCAMPVQFRIDQVTPGPGIAGRSRHDLVPGEVITLVVTDPLPGPGISYLWEIIDKRGSTASLTSTTSSTTTIGPAGAITQPCSFLVELTVFTSSGTFKIRRICSVRTLNAQLRVPVFPETSPETQTYDLRDPDLSTDNAVYTNRSGLGLTEQNPFGWSEWAWELVMAVESASAGSGGPPSGAAGGDLAGSYPNPLVAKLQGRNVASTAPSNGDYFSWDAGTSTWRPTTFPSGLPPTGAASGDLSGSYPSPTVVQLQGHPVQSGAPSDGDIWRFSTPSWVKVPHGAFADGTLGTPGIRFELDPDTGIYRVGLDTLGIVTGGTARVTVSTTEVVSTLPLTVPDGSAGAPAVRFASEPDVGIFKPVAGAISLGSGGERARFAPVTSTLYTHWVPDTDVTKNLGAPLQRWATVYADNVTATALSGLFADGLASAPSIAFTNEPGLGLYRVSAGVLGVAGGGASIARFSVVGGFPQIQAQGGSVANPSYSFIGGATTGMLYLSPELAFSVSGVETLRMQAPASADPQVLLATGSAAKPSLSFIAASTHGLFYDAGGGRLAFAHAGGARLYMSSSYLTPNAASTFDLGITSAPFRIGYIDTVLAAVGTATSPTLAFNGDTDTGFSRGTVADTVHVILGAADMWAFQGNTLYSQYGGQVGAIAAGVVNGSLQFKSGVSSAAKVGLEFNNATLVFNAAAGAQKGARFSTTIEQTGTATFTGVEIDITEGAGHTSTGEHRLLDVKRGGVSQTYITRSGEVRVGAGTLAAPGFSFVGDSNTGVYNNSSDQQTFVCGGTAVLLISTANFQPGSNNTIDLGTLSNVFKNVFANTFRAYDGTAAAPTYSFYNDATLGIYRVGANTLGISVAGTGRLQITNQAFAPIANGGMRLGGGSLMFGDSYLQRVLVDDGLVATPAITFNGDTDLGLYRPAADTLGLAARSILAENSTDAADLLTLTRTPGVDTAGRSLVIEKDFFSTRAAISITNGAAEVGLSVMHFDNGLGFLHNAGSLGVVNGWFTLGTAADYTVVGQHGQDLYINAAAGSGGDGVTPGGSGASVYISSGSPGFDSGAGTGNYGNVVLRAYGEGWLGTEQPPTGSGGGFLGLPPLAYIGGTIFIGDEGTNAVYIGYTSNKLETASVYAADVLISAHRAAAGALTLEASDPLGTIVAQINGAIILDFSPSVFTVDVTSTIEFEIGNADRFTIADKVSNLYTKLQQFATLDGVSDEYGLYADFTVNKASGNYTGIIVDVTEIAAPGTANHLIDLKVASTSKFYVTNAGYVRTADGAQATPAFSFISATNTGFYYTGTTIAAAYGGVTQVHIGNGMLRSHLDLGTDLGTSAIRWNDAYINRVLIGDGSAASPAITFGDDTDTGIFSPVADQIAFAAGGSQRLTITAGSVTGVAPFRTAAGSAAAPAYSFSSDTDTGVYTTGADTLGFTTGGTLRVTLDSLSLTNASRYWGPNGAVGTPSYSFTNDTASGLYLVAGSQVGMTVAGGQTFRWEATATFSAKPIEFASAAMGTPSADTVRVGVPATAGRPRFLALTDPYFGDNFMATAFHDRQKFFLLPSGTTTMVNAGFQMGTSGTTLGYVTPAAGSFLNACQKNQFSTAATLNTAAEIHSTTPLVARGDATTQLGFMFHARFAVGSNYNSSTRLFVGLINSAAALAAATNPNALSANHLVGVGLDSGSTTLNVYTNDAGGAPQVTGTGITVAASNAFDVWIWMPPNSTTRYVYINRINGGAGTYSGNSFNFPPAANTWLYPHSWIATAEAVVKTLYVMRWAIEAGQ